MATTAKKPAATKPAAAKKPAAKKKPAAAKKTAAKKLAANAAAAAPAAPATPKVNTDHLVAELNKLLYVGDVNKAMSMLRSSRFELFDNVNDDNIVGIVRSQGTADRVYHCLLKSTGEFSCGTQNLRPCTLARGSVCKHILVMTIGLVKAGRFPEASALAWVQSTKGKYGRFDKEAAKSMFGIFSGVEQGTVDWRPTELIPEDFYAL